MLCKVRMLGMVFVPWNSFGIWWIPCRAWLHAGNARLTMGRGMVSLVVSSVNVKWEGEMGNPAVQGENAKQIRDQVIGDIMFLFFFFSEAIWNNDLSPTLIESEDEVMGPITVLPRWNLNGGDLMRIPPKKSPKHSGIGILWTMPTFCPRGRRSFPLSTFMRQRFPHRRHGFARAGLD